MLSTVSFSHDAAARIVSPGPLREASRDLARALRTDDLASAQTAYADLVKAMPEGAQVRPGTPFAKLGDALAAGDLPAAKSAYADIFRGHGGKSETQPVRPVPSSTGGTSGTQLDVVA